VRRAALLAGRALALLLGGAVVGVAAVAVHTWWWGLALAGLTTLVSAYAVWPGWLTRLPYAAGWVIACGAAMLPRPSGSYAVSGDGHGYVLIGVGLVMIVLTTATLPLGGPHRAAEPASSPESSPESESGTA
jgi:hypothetical protein